VKQEKDEMENTENANNDDVTRNDEDSEIDDEQRVITIRLPESLHAKLAAEAHDKYTSMNQLCVAKLRQAVVDGTVLPDKRRKGKRE